MVYMAIFLQKVYQIKYTFFSLYCMSETKKKQKKSPKPKTKKAKEPKEPKTKKAKEPKEKKAVTKRGPRKPIIILSSSTSEPPLGKVPYGKSEEPKPLSQMTTLSDPLRASQMTTLTEKIQLSPLNQSLALSSAEPFLKVNNGLKITPENNITMPKRYNEEFIGIMDQLSAIMTKQGEPFRARAYQKAQEAIMTYPGDITSPEDLKGRPNIGPTIMEKLKEYVETGTLRILEREKTNPVNILGEIYGVGPKKAKELVDQGITTIEKLRENQHLLNDVQKVGLQYYEDVLKRIPRAEIDEYKKIVEKVVKKSATTNVAFEIVGSYRRGLQSSGDIDMIITSESEQTFKNLIDNLIKDKIIVAVLSRGPSKCLVMAKIPSSDTIRRVDFLYTTPEEYPFAVLYFTGSKIFNTIMRQHALNMGLTMNEHGLYKFTQKTKGEKVAHIFKTEKDIFDYLQLPYVDPKDRIDGRQLNPPLEKVMRSEEPNSTNTSKVSENFAEPKLQIITQFDEEPIKLAPKVPKVTKAKTLKAKKEKVDKKIIIEEDLAPPFPKVDKKIIIEEDSPLLEKDLAPNVDLALSSAKAFLKERNLTLPLSKSDLDALTEEELTSILNYANIMYRNFQPIMTDNEYDILEDYIKEKYPNNQALSQIGATPVTKNKVQLPYFMGSMDKIKPDTNALQNWKAKYTGPYVLSCKLDGVSGLYTTEESTPKLYTRGDGKVGQDISYLIPYLRLPKTKGLVIRGEFIIAKATFNTKYKQTFANARNMVSGIVNQKSVNPEIMKDVDFVSYELIKPLKKPSEQFAALQKLDINVVLFKKVEQTLDDKSKLTNDLLSETLIDWRETYSYEIDGVIVTNDQIYPTRKAGNPEHSFAFKMVLSDQIAEAKVVDVIWTPSKDGYLKPRVQIEPIQLTGVKIEYATGFNGQFIQENKIGVGATIELIRSGDVIPHIRKVVVPASEAKMPNVPYKWNDTHVDVLLEDIESDEIVKAKNITGFFRGIEVEGLSSGNISRIIAAGYDSVPKILQMTPQDFLKVEGFKEKTSQKLYANIQTQIQAAPIVKIMAASNIFGRGFSDKKLELILEAYPNVLQEQQDANKVQKVAAIKGMALKTAEAFVDKIPAFLAFLHEANLDAKLQQDQLQQKEKQIDQSHPLYNKSIVFTGFRDKQLEETLKTLGAKIGSSVSKNTFVVITKDPLDETGKVLEAKKHNIPIMTPEEFIQIHLIHLIHL